MLARSALSVPAFRRFLVALTAAELGLYAFETALYWTVLETTGSAVAVSIAFSAIIAPMLLLTIPIRIMVDRIGPRSPVLWSSLAATTVVAMSPGSRR